MTYSSTWWSVELPAKWTGHRDRECATFQADPPLGVLQISAARKDAVPVNGDELREYAKDTIVNGRPFDTVYFGAFSGFTTTYRERGLAWQHWWLMEDRLLIYGTYNVTQQHEGRENHEIMSILASLASTGRT
jgi:hypothetical protein